MKVGVVLVVVIVAVVVGSSSMNKGKSCSISDGGCSSPGGGIGTNSSGDIRAGDSCVAEIMAVV